MKPKYSKKEVKSVKEDIKNILRRMTAERMMMEGFPHELNRVDREAKAIIKVCDMANILPLEE